VRPPDLVIVGPVETSVIMTIRVPDYWHEGLGYYEESDCWTSATNQIGCWVFENGGWVRRTERWGGE
jgi:hypothetical protein